jgi:hypothetical protein
VLECLHYRDEKLSNEVKDLNTKLVLEATRYKMQRKSSRHIVSDVVFSKQNNINNKLPLTIGLILVR